MEQKKIILFDGECVICNGFAQFLLDRDKKGVFKYGTLQSQTGKALRNNYGIPDNVDSVILIKNNKSYIYSEAAIETLKEMPYWSWVVVFYIIPKPARNAIYKWIARNRYSWFGKREACRIPTPEERDRFID